MSETSATPQKLDDIMMAMDVVDTLRHRTLVVENELGTDAREEDMVQRLREIYAGQGIEVPDHILLDGVKALEENRFVYEPPQNSFSIKLAKAYVARDRWLKPLVAVLVLALLAVGIYRFGIVGPANSAFKSDKTKLTQTYTQALGLAQTEWARDKIEAIYLQGAEAIKADDRKKLGPIVSQMEAARSTLEQKLTIRIISRPGELSGVFRIPDNSPGTRNYYLIVEALDADNRPVALEITSEEDQTTELTSKWGVRVSEAVFDRVKADKSDDQIIQASQVGTKEKGAVRPTYTIETIGGVILKW